MSRVKAALVNARGSLFAAAIVSFGLFFLASLRQQHGAAPSVRQVGETVLLFVLLATVFRLFAHNLALRQAAAADGELSKGERAFYFCRELVKTIVGSSATTVWLAGMIFIAVDAPIELVVYKVFLATIFAAAFLLGGFLFVFLMDRVPSPFQG